MESVEQIFGAALDAKTREAQAPQNGDILPIENPPEKPVVQTEPMARLATKVVSAMRRNVRHRDSSGVTDRLQYALNANTCRFTDNQIAALSTVVPEPIAKRMFTPLTFTKIRAAKALFADTVRSMQEPLFEVSESPWPEVPSEVDEEVYFSMMRDIEMIFNAVARARGGQPLQPEEEQALLKAIEEAPKKRRDELLARRKEYAQTRARRMQSKIWDIFLEGGGEKALTECVANLCLYGTCFLVGPIPRVVARNVCKEQKSGVRKYTREYEVKPVFQSLNPMDCYPAPDAKEPADGPFCIREKYSAESLWQFASGGAKRDKNGEGWNEEVVQELLDKYPNGGVKFDAEPEREEKKEAENNSGSPDLEDCTFEGVRCFLSAQGKELAEIGIVKNRDGKPIKLRHYYHVEAIVIDNKVVYCRILDARMEVPISKAVFYELPGSFWGESIADKLAFVQMMQNNTGKALFLDLGATGPMIWINKAQQLIDKSPDALKWRPYGFFRFGQELYNPAGAGGAPMGVLDVPTKAAQLIREWEEWQTQADNDSGIPRFAEGQTSGAFGALRTSGGLAQMSEHMMRSTKMIATQYDDGIIKTVAQRIADWILAFDDDMELKGDVYIRPIGVLGRILKAQQNQARLQFLQIVGANQHLQQLLGTKLEMAVARHVVRGLDINADEVMPSEEHARWMEDMNKLAAIAAAEQRAMGGGEEAGPGPQRGTAPQPEMAQGGVEERRGVA